VGGLSEAKQISSRGDEVANVVAHVAQAYR
jgi:hypothetical protein